MCSNRKMKKVCYNQCHIIPEFFKDYEKNYEITELKCLAIVGALDKFYHYVHGQKFTYRSCGSNLAQKCKKKIRGHLFCWSLKLSMFDYGIQHEKDSMNIKVDILS